MTHVTIAPQVLVRNIHQSAWKENAQEFALLDLYTLGRIVGSRWVFLGYLDHDSKELTEAIRWCQCGDNVS